MRRSLAHLPKRKRDELKAVTKTIVEMVPSAQMIILFGSHARGDWVEDVYEQDGRTYEYASDYDILVITESFNVAESVSLWSKVERRIREPRVSKTWTTVISHCIDEVNRKISKSNYFFTDIKKEGICLFSTGKHRLARIRPPDPRERLGMAKSYFDNWSQISKEFYFSYEATLNQSYYNTAAFLLHQAAENLYHTLLLVFTGYKPKLHDLEKLVRLTAPFGTELISVFPTSSAEEKHRFVLLKKAYVEARYEPGYRIEKEDLDYLAERVRRLQEIARTLCAQRIEQYEKKAQEFNPRAAEKVRTSEDS